MSAPQAISPPVSGGAPGAAPAATEERPMPPVTAIGMLSLALIVAGGIYLSAHLPNHVPLLPAVILLIASVVLLAANLLSLALTKGFAWLRFWQIARWLLISYLLIAGLIEYAFLRDHMSGGPLIVLSLSLAVFALQVPIMIAFTVARYHNPGD